MLALWMCKEDVADRLGVDVDACDTRDEVPAVALYEHGVLFEKVVLVLSVQHLS